MHDFVRVRPVSVLFAGGNQPARRDLGILSVAVEDSIVPVRTVDLIKTPFCTVVELTGADAEPQSNVLLVAPLSGHFPVLLRDREGAFRFQGTRVDRASSKQTGLLAIEGELDDIAAPGQTSAAHGLCCSLPDRFHDRVVVPASGHFSLFSWESMPAPCHPRHSAVSR